MKDYKQAYQQKCIQLEQTNLQFTQYQVCVEQSNLIITDLEEEVKELKKRNQAVQKQLNQLKEKRKVNSSSFQKEIQQTKKQREQFKLKFIQFEKKVIELENINESLQSNLRATKATLSQYERRIQKTMEELALLQIQMEESTQSNQQQIARLKSQLKQTEDQLYALHHAKNKNEKTVGDKENLNQSFHSRHSAKQKRSQITQSRATKKNVKFSQTLSQIRSFIAQISNKRQELSKKFEEIL